MCIVVFGWQFNTILVIGFVEFGHDVYINRAHMQF
ncbi:MAG TPA: hypothetical protein DER09_13810 [Prolixibacteraceae bacterium]|nr:hypothetical protein [Prolixibacteraceae bacterium]